MLDQLDRELMDTIQAEIVDAVSYRLERFPTYPIRVQEVAEQASRYIDGVSSTDLALIDMVTEELAGRGRLIVPRYDGQNFSYIVSAVAYEIWGADEAWDDIGRWHAPSECGDGISKAMNANLTNILLQAGLTPREFNELVDERTCKKWSYNSGLCIAEEIEPAIWPVDYGWLL